MSIHKTAGTKFYISPASLISDDVNAMTDSEAIDFFEAIVDWVEVGEVEDYGEIGDSAQAITFTAVGDRRVRKLKGPRDAGVQNLVVGRDPLDDGQDEMIDAEQEDFNHAFKIELADAPSASYSPSVMYYGGLVMTRPTNIGNVTAVTRRTFNIGINTALYEVSTPAITVPTNIVLPSITGASVQVGVTLTAHEGSWNFHPTSYGYQWQHDASGDGNYVNVAVGGTGKTYVPVVGDIADSLRVVVTAINAAGSSVAANSLGTSPIVAA